MEIANESAMTEQQLTSDDYRKLIESKLPGRRLDSKTTITSSLGRVFMLLDERWPSEKPIRQIIRILPGAKDTKWCALLLDRFQRLSAAPLPHVAVPRDVGLLENADFYIVTDDLRFNVRGYVGEEKLLSADCVLALADQIVEGLASLHQQNIYHGGLRTRRLFLNPPPDGRNHETAWIADACVGGLSYWSEGAFTDSEGRNYYPPEWQGRANAPSPSADLFALGVSVAEMLMGTEANPQRPDKAKNYQPLVERYSWRDWHHARSRARDFCMPWAKERSRSPHVLGRLLRCLLVERDVDNAVGLLDRLRRWQRQADRSLWQWRSGLLFVLLIVVWATYSARIGNRDQTIDANSSRDDESQTKLRKLIEQNDELSRERNGLRQEIRDLRNRVPQSPEPPNEKAEKMWSGWEKESPDFDSLMKKVSDFASNPSSDTGIIKTVRDWAKTVREYHEKFLPWYLPNRPNYYALYPLYLKFRPTPWDDVKRQLVDHQLVALNDAATDWRKWAEDDRLHFNDLYVRLASTPNPDAKEILRSWLDETNARKQWEVRLIRGHAPPNWGTARTFALKIDSGSWQKHDNLDWISGESNEYSVSTKFSFEWSPSQKIRFALWEPATWVLDHDSMMADSQDVGGPLAVWQINAHGSIAAEGRSLEFEIVDCPGPPRKKELLNALRLGQ